MKALCVKELVQNALTKIERVTMKNPTLPVLSGVLITAKGNEIVIKATNLEVGVEYSIQAKVEKEGIVAVPATALGFALSGMAKNKNITFEEIEGTLSISAENATTKINTFSHEEFPLIPRVDGATFSIKTSDFCRGIESVMFSASPSVIKPELGSVYIHHINQELIFAATDSFRLAEKRINFKSNGEIPSLLIPIKNATEIVRIIKDINTDAVITVAKNQISIEVGEWYINSRVIDSVFPDYQQIIPKEFITTATFIKEDLANSLKATSGFLDKFNQVKLTINPKEKKCTLYTKNNDLGETSLTIPATLSGDEIVVSYNQRYMTDCLPYINTDSVSIRFSGVGKPAIVSGVNEKNFTYLVMPMNR